MSSPSHPQLDLAPFDTVMDIVGNPWEADLHLFLNGNQFMVMGDLLAAFRESHPRVSRIYYETLPPGLLAAQIESEGRLNIGTLSLNVKADVYTAGRDEMTRLTSHLLTPVPYAANQLGLLVPPGNPKHIGGFQDLGREDVIVAMPNPTTEGISRLAQRALEIVGGPALRKTVFHDKAESGSTRFTTVHHRETVDWLERHQADVGVVWDSEARWALKTKRGVSRVPLDAFSENPVGQYLAAGLREAPHPGARDAFLAFLQSPKAQAIYDQYGFQRINSPRSAYPGF